jgi:hypothetical protein
VPASTVPVTDQPGPWISRSNATCPSAGRHPADGGPRPLLTGGVGRPRRPRHRPARAVTTTRRTVSTMRIGASSVCWSMTPTPPPCSGCSPRCRRFVRTRSTVSSARSAVDPRPPRIRRLSRLEPASHRREVTRRGRLDAERRVVGGGVVVQEEPHPRGLRAQRAGPGVAGPGSAVMADALRLNSSPHRLHGAKRTY